MVKKTILFILMCISIIMLVVIVNSCGNKNISYTKFEISNNVDIEVSSTHMTGAVKKQENKDLLINFINSLELVEKKVKFPNESANVYLQIYDNKILVNDIRFYGGGIVYEYLANMSYVMDIEIEQELYELLESMDE